MPTITCSVIFQSNSLIVWGPQSILTLNERLVMMIANEDDDDEIGGGNNDDKQSYKSTSVPVIAVGSACWETGLW